MPQHFGTNKEQSKNKVQLLIIQNYETKSTNSSETKDERGGEKGTDDQGIPAEESIPCRGNPVQPLPKNEDYTDIDKDCGYLTCGQVH